MNQSFKVRLFLIFALLLMLASSIELYAQKKNKKGSAFERSSNTSYSSMDPKKGQSSGKKIRYLYKTNSADILYGNKCVLSYTHKMGFEYILVMPEEDGDVNIGHFFHNIGTGFILAFKNGPFWKIKVKKRIKKCKQSSGDFVGSLYHNFE